MVDNLKYAGIMLVLIVVQKTLISFIDVTEFKITPDIVLIGLVYIGIRRGKITGSITGFLSGLILDVFSFSFIGLMALAKTVSGFVSGFFHDEKKTERNLNTYVFLLIVIFCSLFNNTIYFTFYFQGTNLMFWDIVIRYIVPTTVYTALLSVIPVIFARRRRFAR